MREGRHLAAIMFMDMVGYSARMQASEAGAIAAVRELWGLVRPFIASRGGQEIDLAGDGMLMEFPGALAAVRCALDVHAALHARNRTRPDAERIVTRAAVHLGDIEHRDGRIYGDGVNIAARLLPLAPPGSIALSAHVRDQLLNALEEVPQRLGTRTLKNIKAPMEIWCLPGPECSNRDLDAARVAARDESTTRRWTFGNATLDERTLELSVAGQSVSLEKKVLEVLMHLLEHAGEVVTKDELMEAVWPGRVIAESTLTSAIGRLRAVLEEDAIKTVHGFGYRLAVTVSVETSAQEPEAHFDFTLGSKPPLRPQWSLVERLGTGGHGEAWLARHDKTRETRVFKFAAEASALASLKREITLNRVLRDSLGSREDFVRVLDWNLEEAPYFLESEYADAGNLGQWAEKQGGLAKVPLETRLELVAQIAEALAAAHSVGVLHKDLKPANVLVDARGGKPRIRLADFGSGGVLDPQRLEELGITRMGFTRTALDVTSTSGTPLYLAPEVIAGQPFTVQSDIYALGVVLYQLVTGDLHKTLAPGWEHDISDDFLREDIALAAAGSAARRLTDAAQLAQRLRALPQRRAERAQQAALAQAASAAKAQAEKLERLRVEYRRLRRVAAAFVLLAGVAVAAGVVAYQQRNKAVAARDQVLIFMADSWADNEAPMPSSKDGKTREEKIEALIRHEEKLLVSCRSVFLGIDDIASCPEDYVRSVKSLLARLYVETRRFAQAIPLYQELADYNASQGAAMDTLQANVLLAQAQADAGQFDAARTALARAGDFDQARSVVATATVQPAEDPPSATLGRFRRVEGLLALHARDYALARTRLEDAVKILDSNFHTEPEAKRIKLELAAIPAS